MFTDVPNFAPVTGTVRDAFDSLGVTSSMAPIIEPFIFAAIMLRIVVQLLWNGSIEYPRKVQIKAA